jgi:photosystem II stability/assembly factor-like uncharacterized protein
MTIRGSGIRLLAYFAAHAIACSSSKQDVPQDAGSDTSASDTGASDSNADSGAPTWVQTAFAGANIVPTLAIDPKDPDVVFIGIAAGSAEQGFFRTKDAGKSWTKLGGGLPDQYAGVVAIHPQNGTLLANPGVEGIWRSTDGGDTWARVVSDPGGVNALLFHPTGNIAWGVTSQRGCIRSGDGGVTWAHTLNSNLPLNQFGLGPFAFDGMKLYLGTAGRGVYVSTDNGDSWTQAASTGLAGVSGADVTNLAATPSRVGVLFAETSFAGVFRSTDSGATFTKLEPGGSGTRYAALALDPSNAQTIFVSANETQGGPGGLFKSTDDGQSWSAFGPSAVPISSVGVASHGTIYAGTIGQGVWRFGVP